jgi:FmdE, Molybdenum formylmethanofuran dehydrogenase operon
MLMLQCNISKVHIGCGSIQPCIPFPRTVLILAAVSLKQSPMFRRFVIAVALLACFPAYAETPEEWIALGSRVHGGFGSFIPLGIKIGMDAAKRLNAKPRELTVLHFDSDTSPCACFADGIAIATCASVGQRTLTIAPEKAPAGDAAVIVIRPRQGGPGFKYTIPMSALAKLGPMNKNLDERGRYDAVMAADDLFQTEAIP